MTSRVRPIIAFFLLALGSGCSAVSLAWPYALLLAESRTLEAAAGEPSAQTGVRAPSPPTNVLIGDSSGNLTPTISSFSPTSGASGNSVTVTGTSFTSATAVRFNGTSANFTVSSPTAIQVTVPAGATTGAISVTTAGGTGASGTDFTISQSLTILWSADHEEGNMSDWYTPAGGGEFNSGNGVSSASTDVAHTGRYSAKATITTPPSPSAVRLFRWTESRVNPQAYYSAWFYFPQIYSPSWWIIDQFKSRSCSTCDPDPFWFVQAGNRPNGAMFLFLTWWFGPWPNGTVEGPHQGEFGGQNYYQTLKDLPTNQWVHIEIFLHQSAAFDGEIVVWQDGVEIVRQSNVRTRYPFMGDEWALSSYSASISPSPATIYFDDAAISTGRLGPGYSAPFCQTSGASWLNRFFVSQSGTFTAQFDATPSAANIDGVVGLAPGNAAAFTDLAASVRFNSSGAIDARNGGAYSALAFIPYVAGTSYHVRMVVNVPTHSYSVYVTPSGGSEQAVGLNYAFRSEQAAANALSALASFTNGGTLQICNFTPP